ncbi:MAG: hypothetical protein P8Z33_14035 [Gammaproteobacteria bacterium]
MFDLSSDQEAIVKQSTNDLKNWLKNEAAHKSLKHLENAKNLWQDDRYDDAFEYAEKNTEELIAEFLQAFSPEMTRFLLTLDEDNAEHYREYIRENSNEWFKYANSEDSKDNARMEPSIWWLEDYKTLRQSNRQQIIELVMMMSETMNEKQKESVLERIDDWIDKIQDVI